MIFVTGGAKIAVNVPSRAALFDRIAAHWAAGQGFGLATLNLDHLVKLRQPGAFRDAYLQHEFVTADGNPIVWLSRLAGRPVDLVPGSDLVVPLVQHAARHDAPVALVGSTPEALSKAAESLHFAAPDLRIVAQISPPFGFDPEGADADRILDQLAATEAQLCLLALGAPKQEIFAARGRQRAPAVGFASIGASLDFLAGTQTRAPVWVRRLALEWVWRLATSPARMVRRYAHCIGILPGHVTRSLALRRL